MKVLILIISFFATIATTDYSGSWEYFTQAQDQDYKGIIVLEKSGDGYTGKLNSSDGFSIDLKDLVVKGDAISFNFDLQGYKVNINGKFVGDKMDANVSVEGMEFPMKATKKK